MRKKTLIFGIVLLLSIALSSFSSYALSASSAVVISADTNEVLFSKDSNKKMSMASTTKIMTALLAVESGRLDEVVTVNDKMIMVEGTSMGLRSGDKLTLFNLVKGMMLLSGNDAANAVALFLCDCVDEFCELMNERAAEIGMKNTHFVTPSGLDHEKHYSTAYDMALLASTAMKNPVFKQIVSEYSGKVEYIHPEAVYHYRNHNRFLTMYSGACGVKTGFTKKSGRCLVTAVESNGTLLIAVTLNAPDDWNDHKTLYNQCIGIVLNDCSDSSFNCVLSVVGGKNDSVSASLKRPLKAPDKTDSIRTELISQKFIYAPVKRGDVVGYIRVYCNNAFVCDYPLTADDSVSEKVINPDNEGIIYKIKQQFRRFERWLKAA